MSRSARVLVLLMLSVLATVVPASASHAVDVDSGESVGAGTDCGTGTAGSPICIAWTVQAVGTLGSDINSTEGLAEFTCTATVVGAATGVTITDCSANGQPALVTGMIGVAHTQTGGIAAIPTNGITVCVTAVAQVPASNDFSGGGCQLIQLSQG